VKGTTSAELRPGPQFPPGVTRTPLPCDVCHGVLPWFGEREGRSMGHPGRCSMKLRQPVSARVLWQMRYVARIRPACRLSSRRRLAWSVRVIGLFGSRRTLPCSLRSALCRKRDTRRCWSVILYQLAHCCGVYSGVAAGGDHSGRSPGRALGAPIGALLGGACSGSRAGVAALPRDVVRDGRDPCCGGRRRGIV